MRTPNRNTQRERGQIIVMVAIMAVALFAIMGLALDVGRMFIIKAELSRAVDAAALAGVLELPSLPNATAKVNAFMAENEPTASVNTPSSPGDNQLQVTASKSVQLYFLTVLGFNSATVSAKATAGFGIQPVDAVMVIDATSSMGTCPDGVSDGCTDGNSCTTQSGCPIKEARDAARSFTDVLIGPSSTGFTKIGVTAFRGCYYDPLNWSPCVRTPNRSTPGVFELSTNATTIKSNINTIGTTSGSGTNVCSGLYKGNEVLFGTGSQTASNTKHYIILLSDGDNVYNDNNYATSPSPGSPVSDCRPNNDPDDDNGYTSGGCNSNTSTNDKALGTSSSNKGLDRKTYEKAVAMKAAGVEIYVVGFGVCGSPPSGTVLCNSGNIGATGSSSTFHDNTADRNLLKCIASSKSGTNDHYFEADAASQLPSIFTTIAQQIAHRLIE
jgi:hypothetical protein